MFDRAGSIEDQLPERVEPRVEVILERGLERVEVLGLQLVQDPGVLGELEEGGRGVHRDTATIANMTKRKPMIASMFYLLACLFYHSGRGPHGPWALEAQESADIFREYGEFNAGGGLADDLGKGIAGFFGRQNAGEDDLVTRIQVIGRVMVKAIGGVARHSRNRASGDKEWMLVAEAIDGRLLEDGEGGGVGLADGGEVECHVSSLALISYH